jgi:DNA processing protein
VNDDKYWLGFSLVPEIGPKRLAHLLNWFGDLPAAWTAREGQLKQCGLDRLPVANLLATRAQIDVDAELAKVEQLGAWIVTLADQRYPSLLSQLPDAPTVLYVRGTLLPDDNRGLGIVGTRKATAYGRDVAYDLAKQLAQNGVAVVSGLAHGIDTAAHRGAIDGGGRTIAVLGCGIDRIYPVDNRDLALDITHHGALVSEFPLGTPPEGRNFPRRNRVISGLTLGVLVVEADLGSGALITAEMALDQGREVFAVPGNIYSHTSRGTNRLIQDGAKMVIVVSDILDELDIQYQTVQTKAIAEHIVPANEMEARLLEQLGADPLHVDDIARLSGLPIATVTSTLTVLELKGLARAVGQMQYTVAR